MRLFATKHGGMLLFFAAALFLMAQEGDWLSVCGRCPSPAVFQKSGTGTANSVALAKMSSREFQDSCNEQGFKGAALAKCVKDEMAADGGKIYKASANCLAGTLAPIDGKQYVFAGVWSNDDIGGGRTRWRDVTTGATIGRDNASGGLALSQQWEVLCPGPLKITTATLATARPVAMAAPRTPPPPPFCNGAPGCAEVNAFAATLTDFRTSTASGYRIVTASLRFHNKLSRPIILGYLSGSGLSTDDRGNRFQLNEATGLRGMGFVRQGEVDPKFVVPAGQSADARMEYHWYPRNNEIFGTRYTMEFTVREILPVSPTQFRVGPEYPLKWDGLEPPASVSSAAPVAAPPAPAPETVAPVAVAADVNHCQGLDRCYSAGPFIAQVTQATVSTANGYQVLGIKVRFRNMSNQPLVLAYKNGTSLAIDNHGQRLGQRGVNYARGIGVSGGGQVSAEFMLPPGQSREAAFEVQRYVGRTLIGTGFAWDVAVEQLEVLPANQLRIVREFSLNFPQLSPGTPASGLAPAPASTQSVGEAAQKLKDIFKRRK